MSEIITSLLPIFAAGAGAVVGAVAAYFPLSQQYRALATRLEHGYVTRLRSADASIAKLRSVLEERDTQLSHSEGDNLWYRDELDRRPCTEKKLYRILAVGIQGTGKTSLTLRMANPISRLDTIAQTQKERYERTISEVINRDLRTQHVLEIRDWGGEYMGDAQEELVTGEIHGLLFVVDLGPKGATKVDHERIERQLRQFQAEALLYFFGSKMLTSCKTVVLFINKSDLLAGTPAEVEAQAKQMFKPLIDNLMRYATQVDIQVLVGSATYGHSTNHLLAHFVERILPRSAYGHQLLQGMRGELDERSQPEDDLYRRTAERAFSFEDDGVESAPQAERAAPEHDGCAAATNGASNGASNFSTTLPLRV